MSTIPASLFVAVTPSVLGVGVGAVDIIGLGLSTSNRVPIGSVYSFSSGAAITAFFGTGSAEDLFANGGAGKGSGYFGGFVGEDTSPGAMLVSQYNQANVGAYLWGGNVSSLTLTQLQAISGTLSIAIDGVAKTGSPNLAAATGFTNAATIIADTLDIEGAQAAAFTGVISGTGLTVSAVTGTIAIGQIVKGAGVTADTFITAGSGTSWTVNNSQTVGSEAMTTVQPGVTYDSLSGAFVVASNTTGGSSTLAFATGTIAAALKLQAAQGAVLSQGAVAATPAGALDAVYGVTQNWATYTTLFNPDSGSANTVKQAFAAWKNEHPNRFAYVCWDPDVTARSQPPQAATLGGILTENEDSGTFLISELSDLNQAAFVMGTAAAIDFEETNGRTDFAFRAQVGLVADVTDGQTAINLGGNPQVPGDFGNHYNYYGAVGSANAGFTWLQRGTVTGAFKWFDSYINQIWLNSLFQNALLTLLGTLKSIPFSQPGANLIEAAMADPIQAGLNFGAYAPGDISAAQIVEVNQAAGANIAVSLQAQGYYLQVNQQTSTVRSNRGPWQITFWYLDRGSVQAIAVSSVALQ